MIFLQLFFTFLKIGAFNFGGGYAMLALIQSEVVTKHGWLTAQEFADMVAVSEMTPGPIGINIATYSGYTTVMNAGYGTVLSVVGALLASFAVLFVPFVLMLVVLRFLMAHRDNATVQHVLRALRITMLGVIASAALLLFTPAVFGEMGFNRQFVTSCLLFLLCCYLSLRHQVSPIALLIASGIVGAVVYAL